MKYVYQQSAFVSDGVGLALAPFAQFTVTNAGDSSPASLWNDKNGESSIDGNVVLADENGFVRFYVDAGSYNISILSGSVELTLYNVDIVEDATSEIATAISQHSSASDPHGDRAHALSLITAHLSATDPHGDRQYARTYTDTAIANLSFIPEVHAQTYADIPTISGRAFVSVAADETNDGLSSLYYHDESGLHWIPLV